MNEKPIVFSGPMVKAILEGRKTQTRRVVNGSINAIHDAGNPKKLYADWPLSRLHSLADGVAKFNVQNDVDAYTTESIKCPYGKPGDRLWVRESMYMDKDGVWLYSADDDFVGCDRADESAMISWAHHKETEHCPSIHMPRWASRITLEIAGVRVERLQDITDDDAKAEGVGGVGTFGVLWNEINAKRGYGWDINPWVWVIEFEKVSAA